MNANESHNLFAAIVSQPDEQIDLARAALLYAMDEYPSLRVERYLRRLDFMAESVAKRVKSDAEPTEVLHRLNEYLFDEEGFRGNRENYQDPRNSYLNEVLDRKLGIPITLSVVYVELAKRLSLPVFGVGMPGHFLVKYEGAETELYVDPFNDGMLMTEHDCVERLRDVFPEAQFHPEYLVKSTNQQILTRMLHNLKNAYVLQKDWTRALRVVEKVLILNPTSPHDIRDLGALWMRLKNYERAIECFDAYLRLAPRNPDTLDVRSALEQLRLLVENVLKE
jgi:regulator of sirC expression with transglutaminase-like and TPR domain